MSPVYESGLELFVVQWIQCFNKTFSTLAERYIIVATHPTITSHLFHCAVRCTTGMCVSAWSVCVSPRPPPFAPSAAIGPTQRYRRVRGLYKDPRHSRSRLFFTFTATCSCVHQLTATCPARGRRTSAACARW